MATVQTTDAAAGSLPSQSRPCWTFLPLSGKVGEGQFTFVDSDTAEQLRGKSIYRNKTGYAWIKENGRTTHVQRIVLGLEPGDGTEADHINRDRLDNRRCNLRVTTRAGNAQNCRPRAKYRGVSRNNQKEGWLARVQIGGKVNCLGTYPTPEEAAEVARAFRAKHMPYATD